MHIVCDGSRARTAVAATYLCRDQSEIWSLHSEESLRRLERPRTSSPGNRFGTCTCPAHRKSRCVRVANTRPSTHYRETFSPAEKFNDTCSSVVASMEICTHTPAVLAVQQQHTGLDVEQAGRRCKTGNGDGGGRSCASVPSYRCVRVKLHNGAAVHTRTAWVCHREVVIDGRHVHCLRHRLRSCNACAIDKGGRSEQECEVPASHSKKSAQLRLRSGGVQRRHKVDDVGGRSGHTCCRATATRTHWHSPPEPGAR